MTDPTPNFLGPRSIGKDTGTKRLSERILRVELESTMVEYLTQHIGMTEDGAKNFAENTIDSWHIYLKKGDTPNERK